MVMNKPAKKADKSQGKDQVAQFEQSLNELEQVVTRMEGGELSLDESLQSFERGINLFRSCQGALEQAQLRVRTLLDPEHPESAEVFPELASASDDTDTSARTDEDDGIPF